MPPDGKHGNHFKYFEKWENQLSYTAWPPAEQGQKVQGLQLRLRATVLILLSFFLSDEICWTEIVNPLCSSLFSSYTEESKQKM